MIGDTFKNFKHYYTKIKVPEIEVEQKWQILENILPEQDVSRRYYHFISYRTVFLSTIFVLVLVTIALFQISKPGRIFYPINILTQEIGKKFTTLKPANSPVIPPKVPLSATTVMKNLKPTKNPTATPFLNSIKKSHIINHSNLNNKGKSKSSSAGNNSNDHETNKN